MLGTFSRKFAISTPSKGKLGDFVSRYCGKGSVCCGEVPDREAIDITASPTDDCEDIADIVGRQEDVVVFPTLLRGGRPGLQLLQKQQQLDPGSPSNSKPAAGAKFGLQSPFSPNSCISTTAGTPSSLQSGSRAAGSVQWTGEGETRDGQGMLTGADGQKYEGQFLNSAPHGSGVLNEFDGSEYQGAFEHNHRHGYGSQTYSDGSTYEGQWIADSKSGHGIQCWPDGSRYEGHFEMGLLDGQGVYRELSGLQYAGWYHQNQRHGEGCCNFEDGRKYSGQWREGWMSGTGRIDWKDGTMYRGEFDCDQRHGEGTLFWPCGANYRGGWNFDERQSEGVYEDSQGRCMEQEWRDGLLVRSRKVVHTPPPPPPGELAFFPRMGLPEA